MTEVRLDGKVAVVVGATGGWGSGAATAMARRGATVVLNSRTQSKLDLLAERMTAQGATALGVAGDVTTLAGAISLVDAAVEAYGRVDVLVHSMGVRTTDVVTEGEQPKGPLPLYGGSLLELSEDAWQTVLTAELSSAFACAKASVDQMVRQGDGGSIVAVLGTILGAAGQSAHAAAKAGVLNAVWSWSDELAVHGIRVNGVRGYVRSLLTDPGFDVADHDFGADQGATLPTEPAVAGEIVAWLASDAAHGVTGAYLGFDGPRATIWEPNLPGTAVYRYPGWTADSLADELAPIVRRRPPRPTMTQVVQDLFSATDSARAEQARQAFAADPG